jgi:hypothetical protein
VTKFKYKLVSVRLKKVLILTQDNYTVCAERSIARKSFWTHPVVLLANVSHVEACFGPFRDSDLCRCNIGERFVSNMPLAQKSFWTHPTIFLGDEAQVEACLSLFRDSANLDAR